MKYSIVNKTELQKNFRIDSEFYSPEYLALEKTINLQKFDNLITYCSFIKKGIFDLPPSFYRSSGVPLIRTSEIKDPLIDFSTTVYLDDDTQKKNRKTELTSGDIVFTKIGAYIGDVAVLPQKFKRYNFSQNVTGLKIKKEEILSGFLLAYLLSDYGQRQIRRVIMLSGQGKLELEDIKNIKIILVKKEFQKVVHDLILKAGIYKEKSLEIHSQAEQILLSELNLPNWKPKYRLSFVKNYSETETAGRIDADYFQPMYEEIVKAITLSNDHFCLGDLVSIKKCIEPGSEAYKDSGIPFLRVSNLSKLSINNDNQKYLSEDVYEQLKQHQPQKGEILLSKDATPGIALYLKNEPTKMIPSGGILRLAVKDSAKILPEYLTLVLNSTIVQKQIEQDVGGSVINHWLVEQVKNTLIPIIPIAKQKRIAETVNESFCNRGISKQLLDIAKRGVELAIEKDEKQAQNWIETELNKIVN